MANFAVRAEHVAKRYFIGRNQARYHTLRDSLTDWLRLPKRWLSGESAAQKEEMWALRDVSFEVQHGEVIGLVGRNGAGKSTLLKILSRITEPTRGQITLHGRVGSLLEVGTGFHPELTGRENIFLSGAVLGMTRADIHRRFDEIVAFSEVERFLDTQVKFYSSGMYVRLAFAVAAHLEPEILVVDEVLAVGDAAFQRKCLRKMEDVGSHGRTVLFVSHNMPAVTRICPRTVLLDAGEVVLDGPSAQVIAKYLTSGSGTSAERVWSGPALTRPGNHIARLIHARVVDAQGSVADALPINQTIGIELKYEVLEGGHVLIPNFHLLNDEGLVICIVHDLSKDWHRRPRPSGVYRSTMWIPANTLAEGRVIVGAALSTHSPLQVHFFERDAVAFTVNDSLDGDSARGDYAGQYPGIVRPIFPWTTDVTTRTD